MSGNISTEKPEDKSMYIKKLWRKEIDFDLLLDICLGG